MTDLWGGGIQWNDYYILGPYCGPKTVPDAFHVPALICRITVGDIDCIY